MKKFLLIAAIGVASLVGAVTLFPTHEAEACGRCNINPYNLECGGCGGSRLFVEKSWYENGRMFYYYVCRDCGHSFVCDGKGNIYPHKKVPN